MNGGNAAWESILDLPKHCTSKVDVMLHQSHSAIFRPALLVVVPNHIFIVWIWVLGQKPLHKFSCLISHKPEDYVHMVNISHVHSDRMTGFNFYGLEKHKLILILRRTCQFRCSSQTQNQQVNDHSIKLVNEGCELKPHDNSIKVGMVHILEINRYIVLCSHVICDVMIYNQP